MAQPLVEAPPAEAPRWKSVLCLLCAILLAAIFLVSGIWKITDPLRTATLMNQALVPRVLSMPAALAFAIAETLSGIFLLIPRYRRWGAWLAGLMLVAFMGYFGFFYTELHGQDCNCFPWIERAVGPAFFIGDAIMLLLAIGAGWWARPSAGLRTAALMLAAITAAGLVSYGAQAARQSGAKAPDTITVDGKPISLSYGKFFLYFFDPECSHCDAAARRMARYRWGSTRVIAVPNAQPQFAGQFLQSTGLKAGISLDLKALTGALIVAGSPAAALVEHGRQKAAITNFDGDEPEPTLRKLGFIE